LNSKAEEERTRIIRSTMKTAYLFVLLCLALACGTAGAADAPSHPSWYGPSDCRIAPVDAPPISELRWSGPCRDGYAEGRGVLSWRSREGYRQTLEGTLVRGEIRGEATLKWDDGASYVGSFAGGRPHGQGYFRGPKGQYEGEYVNGRPEGTGIFLFPNGDRYEGQWKDGLREGQGRMSYALGGSYEGEWQQGMRHGTGVLVYAGSGRRYVGQFVEDRVAGARPLPAATAPSYSLKQDDARVGTNIRQRIVSDADVPLHLGYAQMTPEQRQRIDAGFPTLEEGDEPPYPIGGMKRFYALMSEAIGTYEAQGPLYVQVLVGADGRPVSVTSKGLEGQVTGEKMRYFAALAAMSLAYKPALCRGKPCEMRFPFYLELELKP
jgi:hypothetical protein